MTDFYSQNRCVCSTRSHGPLLCAFCLSFHFKNLYVRFSQKQKWLLADEIRKRFVLLRVARCARRIGGTRNFCRAFIDGVTEPGALKRDNANKHRKSDQHMRAANMHADPFTRTELYKETSEDQ